MPPPALPATPVPCGNAAFALDMNLAQDQTTHILHDHDGKSSAKLCPRYGISHAVRHFILYRRSWCTLSLLIVFLASPTPSTPRLLRQPLTYVYLEERFDKGSSTLRLVRLLNTDPTHGRGIRCCSLHTRGLLDQLVERRRRGSDCDTQSNLCYASDQLSCSVRHFVRRPALDYPSVLVTPIPRSSCPRSCGPTTYDGRNKSC